jgi:hypothetical protein
VTSRLDLEVYIDWEHAMFATRAFYNAGRFLGKSGQLTKGRSLMSHHFDSPTGREDPRLNLCDLYVFAGRNAFTVLIMTVNPDAGLSSPTELREEGLYEFKIDTDDDAQEDVSFRLVVTNERDGKQRVAVRRAEGETSRNGVEGQRLGSGVTNDIFSLEGGGRAWFGVAGDPFIGNGPALNLFVKALAADKADFTPFDNRLDIFENRNVTAIVLEVPSKQIGTGRVGVWASISLHGHAPQRQVARAAWPLMKHLFVRDDHVGARLNEDPPALDYKNAGESIVANVAKAARMTRSVAVPEQYGRYVASRVLPDILPYTINSAASFGFAGVNGRGLADPAFDVVLSIFANRAVAGSVEIDPGIHHRAFPYLAPAYSEHPGPALRSR